jgi:hypothetical protein
MRAGDGGVAAPGGRPTPSPSLDLTYGGHTVIAYLDAGTGSMLVSFAVGGVAAAGVAVRHVRHRVRSKLSRKPAQSEAPADQGAVAADRPATAGPES